MSVDNFLQSGLANRIFNENEVIYLSTTEGTRFGLIPFTLIPLLESFPAVFILKKDSIVIVGENFEERSAAALAFSTGLRENFDEIAKSCNQQNLKFRWRNEKFGVYPIGSDPRFPEEALFILERELCKVLGIESYGVHANVYNEQPDGTKKLWIGKRSMDKSTFPGKLDMAIGGGIVYGLSIQENLEKEADEEAAVSPLITNTANFVKLARYCWHTDFYIKREAIFIFDLDLTGYDDPRPNDGEQTCFQLCELNDEIFKKAEEWKPNSLAMSLDFAKRNGQPVKSEILEELMSDKCNLFD